MEKRITIGMAMKNTTAAPITKSNGVAIEVGQEGVALVLVEARRDELVDLRRDDREREEGRPEHRDLDLREQIFQRRGVDELHVRRVARGQHIGQDQDVVDLLSRRRSRART